MWRDSAALSVVPAETVSYISLRRLYCTNSTMSDSSSTMRTFRFRLGLQDGYLNQTLTRLIRLRVSKLHAAGKRARRAAVGTRSARLQAAPPPPASDEAVILPSERTLRCPRGHVEHPRPDSLAGRVAPHRSRSSTSARTPAASLCPRPPGGIWKCWRTLVRRCGWRATGEPGGCVASHRPHIAALHDFRAIALGAGATSILAVATSAVRESANAGTGRTARLDSGSSSS